MGLSPISQNRLDRLFRAATELFIFRKENGYDLGETGSREYAVTEALKLEAELVKQLEGVK